MAYKFKPNKSVLKRFKVTKTGKVKRHHCMTSHLMSARTPAKKRELRGTKIVAEGFAKNLRQLAGVSGLKPLRTAHNRALRAKRNAVAETAVAA